VPAFLISAETEPLIPHFPEPGAVVRQIVYDAPSWEKAEEWGRGHLAKELLSDGFNEKLSLFQVIPIYDGMLSADGSGIEPFDWLEMRVQALESEVSRTSSESDLSICWNPADVRADSGEFSDPFYLALGDHQGLVIKAPNLLLAARLLFRNTPKTLESSSRFELRDLPRIEQYPTSHAGER